MQYTDNEAALIGGLISNYFLRPAVSAALKDSYIHVLEHLHAGRVSAADIFDADLSDVQRGPARPDGRQPEDDGAAKFLPLIAKTTNRQKCCRLTFRQHFFYTEKSAPKGAPRR